MILPDSSAWIAFFKPQHSGLGHRLHRLIDADADICVCGLVLSEVLCGLSGDKLAAIKEVFDEYPYVDSDRATHEHAAAIFRQCRAGGYAIRNIADCIIAATALKHDAELLHHDRDFSVIARFVPLKIC